MKQQQTQDASLLNSPMYYVKMPLVQYELNVRGLTVRDEDLLKGSATSPKKMSDTLNHIMYDCMEPAMKTGESAPFPTYNAFINGITPSDRDALLFGIIMASYDAEHDMSIQCGSCNTKSTETINLASLLKVDAYTGSTPLLSKRPKIQYPEYGWTVSLKQPTLADEIKILSSSKGDSAPEHQYLIVDNIETTAVDDAGNTIPIVVSNPIELYGLFATKPAKVRKRLIKEWKTSFGDYGITALFEGMCSNCGTPISINISPLAHLFFLVAHA